MAMPEQSSYLAEGIVNSIGRLIRVSTNKTIVADGDYAANDVLSESKASGTAWEFKNCARANGRGGYITRASIIFSKNGGITTITGRYSLLLFNATPTSNLNDNGANTAVLDADKALEIGRIDFPALSSYSAAGSPFSQCTPNTAGGLPLGFVCGSGETSIYGILVALDAEANETASTIVTINLLIEQY